MGLFGSLFSRFSKNKATPEEREDFRKILIESDIGPRFTDEILEVLAKTGGESLQDAIVQKILASLTDRPRGVAISPGNLTTILMVGVNGTGKTTSSAKLAQLYRGQGLKVMLAAADTFRAAAVDQLQTWGSRIDVPVITGKERSDPAAVSFDAATRAKQEGYDVLIIDTAGRLHTKDNLMAELSKVKRVVEKVTPIQEVLFVLDGTTGQMALLKRRVSQKASR